MLYILKHLPRSENQWTYRIIGSIKKEMTHRRYDYTVVTDVKATIKKCAATGDVVLIPNELNSNCLPIVEECNNHGVQVIAANSNLDLYSNHRYHAVTGDISNAIAVILHTFRENNLNNAALYGVNTNSQNDVAMAEMFVSQTKHSGKTVFANSGSMKQCFDEFFHVRNNFNVVICVNDYVAISLLENLKTHDPESLQKLHIISFSNTIISKLYDWPITSFYTEVDDIARAVVDIYRTLRNNRPYSSVSICIPFKINNCNSNNKCLSPFQSAAILTGNYTTSSTFDTSINYETDPEVSILPKIEIFLNSITGLEYTILSLVLQDKKSAEISELLYLSEDAIQYHVKKMRKMLGIKTTREFCNALNKYIVPEKLIEIVSFPAE